MIIIAKRTWGIRDILKSLESKGRKAGKPKGSHIVDLADLKKAILLCDACVKGFNPKKHNYFDYRPNQYARGKCDVCRTLSNRILAFLHESFRNQGP